MEPVTVRDQPMAVKELVSAVMPALATPVRI